MGLEVHTALTHEEVSVLHPIGSRGHRDAGLRFGPPCPECKHPVHEPMALRLRFLAKVAEYRSPGLCHHDIQLEQDWGDVECPCKNAAHLE